MKRVNLLVYIPLLTAVLFISGCTTTFHTLTNSEHQFEQTDAGKIIITTNDKTTIASEEIGFISTTQTNIDVAKKILRNYAASIGGNALINFKISVVREYIYVLFIPIPVDRYVCRGTVIRYI